jgi:hypothetical protein
MEKIVAEDGYVIGTLEHLRLLYLCAKQKEENHICEYRWTLGVKVIQDLDLVSVQRIWNDEHMELFGIPVEIDFNNTETVKLWKNITNEV